MAHVHTAGAALSPSQATRGTTSAATLVRRIPLFMAALVLAFAEPVLAQQPAIVTYQVAFNGGPFGAVQIVSDNDLNDTDARPFFVDFGFNASNGVITVAGEMIGEGIPSLPGDPPAPGRRLRITALTASVPLGYFTPLNTPFPSVEVVACYDYSLLPVGPPYNFASRLTGSLINIAGGGNDIDFAQVGYNADCGCGLGRTQLFEHGHSAAITPPPVLFDTLHNHGLFAGTCPRLGAYLLFKLRNDGDAVSLPTSADSSVTQGPPGAIVPALPPAGIVVMFLALLSAAMWVARRARLAA